MKYLVSDPFKGMLSIFNTKEEAEYVLAALRNQLLEEQPEKFTAVMVVQSEIGESWVSVDLTTGPEFAVYKVYNHFSGLHEEYITRINALERLNYLKNTTFKSLNLDTWTGVPDDFQG